MNYYTTSIGASIMFGVVHVCMQSVKLTRWHGTDFESNNNGDRPYMNENVMN